MPTFAHPPVESPLDDTIHFRQATPSDIPCLIHLVTSAYRGDDSRAGWTTEADLLDGPRIDADQIVQMLAQPRSRVIVAQRNGRIEACAHVCVEHDGGYFGMFAVEPRLPDLDTAHLVVPVRLREPRLRVRLAPGTLDEDWSGRIRYRARFSASTPAY